MRKSKYTSKEENTEDKERIKEKRRLKAENIRNQEKNIDLNVF
jgi:hypothetical protein